MLSFSIFIIFSCLLCFFICIFYWLWRYETFQIHLPFNWCVLYEWAVHIICLLFYFLDALLLFEKTVYTCCTHVIMVVWWLQVSSCNLWVISLFFMILLMKANSSRTILFCFWVLRNTPIIEWLKATTQFYLLPNILEGRNLGETILAVSSSEFFMELQWCGWEWNREISLSIYTKDFYL